MSSWLVTSAHFSHSNLWNLSTQTSQLCSITKEVFPLHPLPLSAGADVPRTARSTTGSGGPATATGWGPGGGRGGDGGGPHHEHPVKLLFRRLGRWKSTHRRVEGAWLWPWPRVGGGKGRAAQGPGAHVAEHGKPEVIIVVRLRTRMLLWFACGHPRLVGSPLPAPHGRRVSYGCRVDPSWAFSHSPVQGCAPAATFTGRSVPRVQSGLHVGF